MDIAKLESALLSRLLRPETCNRCYGKFEWFVQLPEPY